MAMAAAVLGLAVAGVVLDDVATTDKTMPDFVQRWTEMLTQESGPAPALNPSRQPR